MDESTDGLAYKNKKMLEFMTGWLEDAQAIQAPHEIYQAQRKVLTDDYKKNIDVLIKHGSDAKLCKTASEDIERIIKERTLYDVHYNDTAVEKELEWQLKLTSRYEKLHRAFEDIFGKEQVEDFRCARASRWSQQPELPATGSSESLSSPPRSSVIDEGLLLQAQEESDDEEAADDEPVDEPDDGDGSDYDEATRPFSFFKTNGGTGRRASTPGPKMIRRKRTASTQKPDDSSPSAKRLRHREPLPRATDFADVYQGGKASEKYIITHFPLDGWEWWILRCAEHKLLFISSQPVKGASKHLRGPHMASGKHPCAVRMFGTPVENCTRELADKNNAAARKAYRQGHGFPEGYKDRTEQWMKKQAQLGTTGYQQTPAVPSRVVPPKPRAGDERLVETTPGGVYTWTSLDRAKLAALRLPNGDFHELGFQGCLADTGLLEARNMPECYTYDAASGELNWKTDFEDGGPRVGDRQYPVMYFNNETLPRALGSEDVNWVSVKRLEPYDANDRGIPYRNVVQRYLFERTEDSHDEPQTRPQPRTSPANGDVQGIEVRRFVLPNSQTWRAAAKSNILSSRVSDWSSDSEGHRGIISSSSHDDTRSIMTSCEQPDQEPSSPIETQHTNSALPEGEWDVIYIDESEEHEKAKDHESGLAKALPYCCPVCKISHEHMDGLKGHLATTHAEIDVEFF